MKINSFFVRFLRQAQDERIRIIRSTERGRLLVSLSNYQDERRKELGKYLLMNLPNYQNEHKEAFLFPVRPELVEGNEHFVITDAKL